MVLILFIHHFFKSWIYFQLLLRATYISFFAFVFYEVIYFGRLRRFWPVMVFRIWWFCSIIVRWINCFSIDRIRSVNFIEIISVNLSFIFLLISLKQWLSLEPFFHQIRNFCIVEVFEEIPDSFSVLPLINT